MRENRTHAKQTESDRGDHGLSKRDPLPRRKSKAGLSRRPGASRSHKFSKTQINFPVIIKLGQVPGIKTNPSLEWGDELMILYCTISK